MTRMNHNKAFGKALRKLRLNAKMSQDVLAMESGLDRTFISLLELGQRSPTLDTILALSTALGMSMSHLVLVTEDILKDPNG